MQSSGIKTALRVFGIILLLLSAVMLVLFGILSNGGLRMSDDGQTLIYAVGIIGIIVGAAFVIGSFFTGKTDETNKF